MKFLDLSADRQVKQYLSITQTEAKILEWKGNGINEHGNSGGFMPSLFREIFCEFNFQEYCIAILLYTIAMQIRIFKVKEANTLLNSQK